jgi:hypothetical protein
MVIPAGYGEEPSSLIGTKFDVVSRDGGGRIFFWTFGLWSHATAEN